MAKNKVAPDLKIQDASGLTDADWAQIKAKRSNTAVTKHSKKLLPILKRIRRAIFA